MKYIFWLIAVLVSQCNFWNLLLPMSGLCKDVELQCFFLKTGLNILGSCNAIVCYCAYFWHAVQEDALFQMHFCIFHICTYCHENFVYVFWVSCLIEILKNTNCNWIWHSYDMCTCDQSDPFSVRIFSHINHMKISSYESKDDELKHFYAWWSCHRCDI